MVVRLQAGFKVLGMSDVCLFRVRNTADEVDVVHATFILKF